MLYHHPTKSVSFDQYVKNELAYYDDHPEEDDSVLECHTNALDYEVDYCTST